MMQLLGPTLALAAAVALIAAVVTVVRTPRTGTAAERGIWVVVIFFVPIVGPLLYLINRRRRDRF